MAGENVVMMAVRGELGELIKDYCQHNNYKVSTKTAELWRQFLEHEGVIEKSEPAWLKKRAVVG